MKTRYKIYIIEDDFTITQLLSQHLSNYYDVSSVSNFRDIMKEVRDFKPDLILMDISLPYFNGFYWTSEIRKTMTIPIIFISSSSDDMDAVMALNMGGDDFITKPFSLTVLEAKILAFLRRSNLFTQDNYTFQGFTLELDGHFISPKGKSVDLSPTEIKIMKILISQPEKIIEKETFLEKLWQDDSFIDHNTLSVNIARLRKKLKTIDFDGIRTARGVGYFLK